MFLKKNFSDEGEDADGVEDVASFSTVSRSNVGDDDDTFEPTEENGAVKASTALLLLLHRAKVARNAADNFHIMVQVQ
jgi:hypothetical protein